MWIQAYSLREQAHLCISIRREQSTNIVFNCLDANDGSPRPKDLFGRGVFRFHELQSLPGKMSLQRCEIFERADLRILRSSAHLSDIDNLSDDLERSAGFR